MNPVSPLPVFFALAAAMATVYVLGRLYDNQPENAKFLAVDGLRGYLAFFVFLHHACIYYFYLKTYAWELPPSRLYSHLGSASVSLFFMITSFLFFTKLINGRHKPVDWLQLFVSRLLRLYPLLLVAVGVSVLYAFIVAHFQLRESMSQVAKEIGYWLLFSVYGGPGINAFAKTDSFMLSVLWSIKYEWIFYLFLPLIGVSFFRSRPSWLTLLITLAVAYSIIDHTMTYMAFNWIHFFSFSGGIAAAFLVRSKKFCELAATRPASLLIIASLACTVIFFDTSYEAGPTILLSVAFIGIACGNSLFGALTFQPLRELGRLSYGIYLLHGLLLYALFNFYSSFDEAREWSPITFWLMISLLGAILTVICFFLHHYLEAPAMRATKRVTAFLRKPLFTRGKTEPAIAN